MKKNSGLKLIITLAVIIIAAATMFGPMLQGLNLGLDLQGGAQVVLQAVPDKADAELTDDVMNQIVDVMRNRIDAFGVSEPVIQREGKDRVIIELAGVDNPEAAIAALGQTYRLEFRDSSGTVLLTGAHLKDAYAQINSYEPESRRYQVVLEFDAEGTQLFADATRRNLFKTISIYIDDVEKQSPRVETVITNGVAVISGGFASYEEAVASAAMLRGGALPVDIQILSQSIIGPSLGADSLAKSVKAAIVGFALLAAFMLALYRLPGAWACVSLVAYSLIVLAVLNYIDATLTMTSIAGFILSIGMAVDANIIIYERIKEELYHGKSLTAAIDSGFTRALWTILDSNITTLIAAAVLYFLGSGSIRGFALTLSIGLIASLFTAIIFTHYVLRWMSRIPKLANKAFYGV